MARTVARWVILVAVMAAAPTAFAHAQQEHARTRIQNRSAGGAVFTLTLPADEKSSGSEGG